MDHLLTRLDALEQQVHTLTQHTRRATQRFRNVMMVALILAVAVVLGSGRPATAADPPDAVIDLPAGLACNDFDLRIEIRGGNQVMKEFTDKNGNVIRTLSAGTGSALSFTNLSTGATFSLKSNGAAEHTTINPDGSRTRALTGR